MSDANLAITDPQIGELIALIKKGHDFDFSDYSKASFQRRLSRIMMLKKLGFDELIKAMAGEPGFFQWFLEEITVNVTE
ncbi:MAG: protein-glutamate O-methyltransferase CheR, partial [Mucilaginibacter sp.]